MLVDIDTIIEEVKSHDCCYCPQHQENYITIQQIPRDLCFLIVCDKCKNNWTVLLKNLLPTSIYSKKISTNEDRIRLSEELSLFISTRPNPALSRIGENLWTKEDLLLILLTGEER